MQLINNKKVEFRSKVTMMKKVQNFKVSVICFAPAGALGTHVPALWYHCWYVSFNWWLNEPFIFQGTSFKKWFYLFMICVSNNSFLWLFGMFRAAFVWRHICRNALHLLFSNFGTQCVLYYAEMILNCSFLLMNCFFEDGDKEPVQVCGINVVLINVF